MSVLEIQREVERLSPAERRALARHLQDIAPVNPRRLEQACVAANRDDAMAAEVEEWQGFDDTVARE